MAEAPATTKDKQQGVDKQGVKDKPTTDDPISRGASEAARPQAIPAGLPGMAAAPVDCLPVRYFLNGNVHNCAPARITKLLGRGTVNLVYDTPGGGMTIGVRNVKHCSDPFLLGRPDFAREFGTWDFLESFSD